MNLKVYSIAVLVIASSCFGVKVNPHANRDSMSGQKIPNIEAFDEQFQKKEILDSSSNLTMLIFWASWCGPCRKEIPQLKEIYKAYSSKGLRMVSVSIDQHSSDWQLAKEEEKMMWSQYLVDKNSASDIIRGQLGIEGIPVTIFVNKEHAVVKRFDGYSKSYPTMYAKVIEENLPK